MPALRPRQAMTTNQTKPSIMRPACYIIHSRQREYLRRSLSSRADFTRDGGELVSRFRSLDHRFTRDQIHRRDILGQPIHDYY
jgi:hypothetical protein